MLGNRLVIGLDYGTTYTGISFCETSDTKCIEERIQIVQDWPASHTQIGTKEKVPSEIAYGPDGKCIGWGSKIPPHAQRYMWTKLELDSPKTGEAEKIRQELASMSVGGKGHVRTPIIVISEFLAKVKDHLVDNLDRQYGEKLWRTLPITLVVTVPAVWSDAAKARTLQAVSKAGFNEIEFPKLMRTVTTTEPEAAAIYTIKSLKGSVQDEQLAVGDGFVVCDMGGGTVDLISYRVASIEPTSVEEATIGSGDQCGGTFVDRAFLKWLEKKLGIHDFVKIAHGRADEMSRTSLPPKLAKIMSEFSLTAKSGFSGTEEYYLTLPASLGDIEDEERGISDGEIHLKASDMIHMFEGPLRRTEQLLTEQLNEAGRNSNVEIKYIFMVGGFAESPYMYGQIKTLAQTLGHIEVIKPAYAWSAIARGATAKGLEGDGRTAVRFRICRRHYGTGCCMAFVRGVHRESDSFICPFTGGKRAHNQMDWLISKGQELPTSVDVHGTIPLSEYFWNNERRVTRLELLASDDDKAPTRSTDPNINRVTDLVIDLSSVPESEFKPKFSPGGALYHHVRYEVQISVHSTIKFWLCVNGTKYGSVTANYA